MGKDVKKLVEGYKKYNGGDVKVHKTPDDTGATLSKSDLEEPYNIDKCISFICGTVNMVHHQGGT